MSTLGLASIPMRVQPAWFAKVVLRSTLQQRLATSPWCMSCSGAEPGWTLRTSSSWKVGTPKGCELWRFGLQTLERVFQKAAEK